MLPAAAASAPPAPAPAAPAFTAPFSPGAVIGKSFSVWLANFVPFSIVTLAVYSPVLLLAALTPADGDRAIEAFDRLLSGLAGFVVTGALTYGVLESLRGGRAPVGALFGTGFRKMGAVFGTSFRVGLWMILGFLLLIVPGVIWYCSLYVAIPAVVVEATSSADALERSRELTKGSRKAIFVVALVVGLVSVVAFGAAALGAAVVQFLPHPVPVVVATAVIALASSFGACASAVAYHDLRVAKEGLATADLVKVFE